MKNVFINYEHLKKEYGVETEKEVDERLLIEMNRIDDEFETMKGFAPFSAEELKEVKLEWREHDLREVLTGNMDEDLKIIKKYNKVNNL